MLSEDMIQRLMDAGLSKQQATSATANAVATIFSSMDDRELHEEACKVLTKMQNIVRGAERTYYDTIRKYSETIDKLAVISEKVGKLVELRDEIGAASSEKAKEAAALYSSLIALGVSSGANPTTAVINAGYILYAYLGGQASITIEGKEPEGKAEYFHKKTF